MNKFFGDADRFARGQTRILLFCVRLRLAASQYSFFGDEE